MGYQLDDQRTASLLNPPVLVLYNRPDPTKIRPTPSQDDIQIGINLIPFQSCGSSLSPGTGLSVAFLPKATARLLLPGQGAC
jgi:hypothetical protein